MSGSFGGSAVRPWSGPYRDQAAASPLWLRGSPNSLPQKRRPEKRKLCHFAPSFFRAKKPGNLRFSRHSRNLRKPRTSGVSKNEGFFSRKTKPNRAQKETQHKTQRYEQKFGCQQGRSGERCEAKIQQSTTCSFQYMSWARISTMLEGLVCCDSLRIASHQRPFFVNSNTG